MRRAVSALSFVANLCFPRPPSSDNSMVNGRFGACRQQRNHLVCSGAVADCTGRRLSPLTGGR
jgi:hypothetical protein